MAESSESSKQYAYPSAFQPELVTDVKKGDVKYWCRCGLSKKQPWCDGSHKGTGIGPLKWEVGDSSSGNGLYAICCCKETANPPFCDGTHLKISKETLQTRVTNCSRKADHNKDCKMCTGCGGIPELF